MTNENYEILKAARQGAGLPPITKEEAEAQIREVKEGAGKQHSIEEVLPPDADDDDDDDDDTDDPDDDDDENDKEEG